MQFEPGVSLGRTVRVYLLDVEQSSLKVYLPGTKEQTWLYEFERLRISALFVDYINIMEGVF